MEWYQHSLWCYAYIPHPNLNSLYVTETQLNTQMYVQIQNANDYANTKT